MKGLKYHGHQLVYGRLFSSGQEGKGGCLCGDSAGTWVKGTCRKLETMWSSATLCSRVWDQRTERGCRDAQEIFTMPCSEWDHSKGQGRLSLWGDRAGVNVSQWHFFVLVDKLEDGDSILVPQWGLPCESLCQEERWLVPEQARPERPCGWPAWRMRTGWHPVLRVHRAHLPCTVQVWLVRPQVWELTLRWLPAPESCQVFEKLLKPLSDKILINKSNGSNTSCPELRGRLSKTVA